jgi:hypothetical protein
MSGVHSHASRAGSLGLNAHKIAAIGPGHCRESVVVAAVIFRLRLAILIKTAQLLDGGGA